MPDGGVSEADGPVDRDPIRVRRMFASIAPRYDRANRLLSFGLDTGWRRAATRALAPAPGQKALDLACGTGDLARSLARPGALVVGADFTLPMLQAAKRRPGVVYAGADGLRLPFADGSFDRVTIAFGLRNFADRHAGLREMRRVLGPGGRIGILEFSRPRGPAAPLLRLYVHRLMPRLGRLISGRHGPYAYLSESIRSWPDQERLAADLAAAGFENVRWRNLCSGVAALHTASAR